jgi:ectoine hydroxylase-related dioxygenase (phytanoyl-CoA dioxygenase family)
MDSIDRQAVLNEFDEQGFVVLHGILDPYEDIRPVVDEYERLLDRLSREWHAQGKLSSAYEDLSFAERLTEVARETEGDYFQHFDISLPQSTIDAETPLHTGPKAFGLLRNERLLDAVEIFVGSEIFCNPVQHARIKPPFAVLPESKRYHAGIAKTQWHQDLGVVADEADDSDILTVWLPVTEATEENGCLEVVPRSHRHGLDLHCVADGGKTGIPDKNIAPSRVPLPMKPGDALFMTKYTQHGSLENLSNTVRWSFDLRYNPTGQATGRPWFPGFIARSRSNPESEMHDPVRWAERWLQTRAEIAATGTPAFRRWDPNDPLCA